MFTQFPRPVLILAGCLAFFAPALFAAGTNDDWLARWWQTEDGLPNNSVNGVAQTSDGYLWVGTPTGLARFDGLHFETISLTNIIPMPNRGIVTMIRGRSVPGATCGRSINSCAPHPS